MNTGFFQKTLSSPVSLLMDKDPLRVYPDDPLTRVRALFRSTRARIAYVVDPRKGKLLGRITRADILTITSLKSNALVESVMEEPPVVLDQDSRVEDALRAMLRADEWYAPVVEGGTLRGSLGLENIIQSMLEENPDYLAGREVEEVMTRDVKSVSPDDFVSSIWDLMREYNYAGLPVVDEKGRLVGIVTQYDLLASGVKLALESSGGPHHGPRVREVMTTSVEYLYPWSSVKEAAELIVRRGYGRLPVVESETSRRLAGIVDREDVVRLALG